jgi:hypothetical protein
MIRVAAMATTVIPPTMPPAMGPAFELLPFCEGSCEEVDEEVAETPENEIEAEDVRTVVAPPIPVVFEELGLPISAPGAISGESEKNM